MIIITLLPFNCQINLRFTRNWCGLVQIDLDLNIRTPFWWHNDGPKKKTAVLTHEFESAELPDGWVQTVHHGKPMIVHDAENVKNTEWDLLRFSSKLQKARQMSSFMGSLSRLFVFWGVIRSLHCWRWRKQAPLSYTSPFCRHTESSDMQFPSFP